MKFLLLTCALITSVISGPVPQDFDFDPQIFEVNINQGSLSPQGFTIPDQLQRNQAQSFASSQNFSPDQNFVPTQNFVPSQNFVSSQNAGRVSGNDNGVQIVRYVSEYDEDQYKYTYELSDGTINSAHGVYKNGVDEAGNPTKILFVVGQFSYPGPDGETYWTNYEADEKGYRPKTGKGVGGIKPGEDAGIDPNLLKSLVG